MIVRNMDHERSPRPGWRDLGRGPPNSWRRSGLRPRLASPSLQRQDRGSRHDHQVVAVFLPPHRIGQLQRELVLRALDRERATPEGTWANRMPAIREEDLPDSGIIARPSHGLAPVRDRGKSPTVLMDFSSGAIGSGQALLVPEHTTKETSGALRTLLVFMPPGTLEQSVGGHGGDRGDVQRTHSNSLAARDADRCAALPSGGRDDLQACASGDRVKVNHGLLLRQLDRRQDGAVFLGA